MGEIIRSDAATKDIGDDGNDTLAKADAKGGVWKTLADERLGPTVLLFNKIDGDIKTTELVLVKIEAELDVFDGVTDDFIGAKADEMWNLVGRPAFDPAYSLIWPAGFATYADGSDDEQPDRMTLLADLLDLGLHPMLDPAWVQATSDEVRSRAEAYRTKAVAVKSSRTKAKLLNKSRTTLARAIQMELSRLKRKYLGEGFSEADIHAVIPDRPRAKAGKSAEPSKGPPKTAKPAEPPTETPKAPQ